MSSHIFTILKQYITNILTKFERIMYELCKKNNIMNNLDNTSSHVLLEKIINDFLNHTLTLINNRSNTNTNDLFDEIRINVLYYPICLIKLIADIIQEIYKNIDRKKLNLENLDDYINSFKNQVNNYFKINENNIKTSIKPCNEECENINGIIKITL